MRDPRDYLEEIRQGVEKMRAQGQVTPAENALFGMVDGLGGLLRTTLERVAELERRMNELHGPGPRHATNVVVNRPPAPPA